MFLSLIFFLLIKLGSNFIHTKTNYSQLQDQVELVTEVRDYYRASSVFDVFNDKHTSMTSWTKMFYLSRAFSNNHVFFQTIKLSLLSRYVKYYQRQAALPLYVITLKVQADLDDFSRFAQNYSMSLNLWLVFIYQSDDLLRFCNRPSRNLLNVAFDTKMLIKCENSPYVWEWYSLEKDQVLVNEIATWTRAEGFIKINSKSLWERRSTLNGKRIRIATVKESLYAVSEQKPDRGSLHGLFGSALRALAEKINFTVELIAAEEMYGNYCPKYGKWSGVVGRVVAGDADIGVAEFGRSERRLDAVDFTVPLFLARMNLYLRKPNITATIMWHSYLKVLDKRIWALSLCLLIICSFLIAIMTSITLKKQILPLIAENCFYIWGILCQQGLPEFPSASSLKLAFISLFISSMVIYMSYSATFTSYLTVFTPTMPFNSEQEFLNDKSYNLTVLRGSVYQDIFERANRDITKQMKKHMKRTEDLPNNMPEAFDQICYQKVAFYASDVVMDKIRAPTPCQLAHISTGRLDSAAFILIKTSPYRGILNYHIENFRSNGILKLLSTRHLQRVVPVKTKYSPVGFWSVVPILTIFIGGSCFSMIVLIFEYLHYYRKVVKKQRARKRNIMHY